MPRDATLLYGPPKLDDTEVEVIERIDSLRKTLRYQVAQTRRWTGLLRRASFARAIRASNSIEGYDVSKDDALAAVEGDQPLEAEATPWAAVSGYRNAMTYVLQLADDPHFTFSLGLIRSLHFMMMQYDLTKNPGRWRPGSIFIRNEQGGVVYEGPDADELPALMMMLVRQLRDDQRTKSSVPAVVRGAMGHLNLVMIHPFSDGNGRMARCLQTLILAREGILGPQFCSIEEYLGRNTGAYYDILAGVSDGRWSPHRNVRPWLRFCLTAHYRQASTFLKRVRETERVFERLDHTAQRSGLPDRVVCALGDAAFGYKVRNSTYRSAAEITDNLASRDLAQLVKLGFLIPEGETRGRYYVASPGLKQMREDLRERRVIEDPFTSTSPASSGPRRLSSR